MCSRARRRSVWMSERKAPWVMASFCPRLLRARAGAIRAGAGRGAALAVIGLRVLALDVGLGLVVLRLRVLLASALFVALHAFALLLGDLVLVLGLRFIDLALVPGRRLVFLLELGLGDLVLALGVGFAHLVLVAFHLLALRHRGLVIRLDVLLVRLLRLAVDLRPVGAARRRGGALRLGRTGECERNGRGDAQQFQL